MAQFNFQFEPPETQKAQMAARGDTWQVTDPSTGQVTSSSATYKPSSTPQPPGAASINPTYNPNPTNTLMNGTQTPMNPTQFASLDTAKTMSNLTQLPVYDSSKAFLGGQQDPNYMLGQNANAPYGVSNAGLLADTLQRSGTFAAQKALQNSYGTDDPFWSRQGLQPGQAPAGGSIPAGTDARQSMGGPVYSPAAPAATGGAGGTGGTTPGGSTGGGSTTPGAITPYNPRTTNRIGLMSTNGAAGGAAVTPEQLANRPGWVTNPQLGNFAPIPTGENAQPEGGWGQYSTWTPQGAYTPNVPTYQQPGVGGGGQTPAPGGGSTGGGGYTGGGGTRTPGQDPYPLPGAPGTNQQYYPTGAYPQPNNSIYNYQNPYFDESGNNIDRIAANDRSMAIQRGESLDYDLRNQAGYNADRASGYEAATNAAYGNIAGGQGGYTADEKNAILRGNELYGLQQTPEEAQSNYLTAEEQAGMAGAPGELSKRMQEGYTQQENLLGDYGARTREAVNAGATGQRDIMNRNYGTVRGAITAGGQAGQDILADTGTNQRNALSWGEQNVSNVIDPTRLTLSDEFNQNYKPVDVQGMVDRAGRTVGAGTAATTARIERLAQQQGSYNPLGVAAATDRARQTGEIAGADAMTNARLDAEAAARTAVSGKEQMRLGAEQQYSGLAAQNAQELAARRLAAEQGLGTAGLQQNQYYTGLSTGAEQQLGTQALGNEAQLAERQLANEQNVGQTNLSEYGKLLDKTLDTTKWTDTTAAARAAQIAANRQATNVANQNTQYQRGMDIYGRASTAQQNFANTRLGQEQEYRGYLTGAQQQANQNVTVANQQRGTNYAAQMGAQQGATKNQISNYAVPGLGTQIAKTLIGAKGGVVKGPTPVLTGEAGPELIVDLMQYKPGKFAAAPNGNVYDPNAPMLDSYNQPIAGGSPVHTADEMQGSQQAPWQRYLGGIMSHTKLNPLYKQIVEETNKTGSNYADPGPDTNTSSAASTAGGLALGLLSGKKRAGGGLLSLIGLEEGGVVAPQQQSVSQPVAPGVQYVNGPQVKTLGQRPTAVVPLTYRPDAKVTMDDLPALAARYQQGGRPGYPQTGQGMPQRAPMRPSRPIYRPQPTSAPVPAMGDGGVIDSLKEGYENAKRTVSSAGDFLMGSKVLRNLGGDDVPRGTFSGSSFPAIPRDVFDPSAYLKRAKDKWDRSNEDIKRTLGGK